MTELAGAMQGATSMVDTTQKRNPPATDELGRQDATIADLEGQVERLALALEFVLSPGGPPTPAEAVRDCSGESGIVRNIVDHSGRLDRVIARINDLRSRLEV